MTYFRPKDAPQQISFPKPIKVEKSKSKPIKKFSEKREKQNKEYLILRKIYLENYPLCEVKLKGCTNASTEIHHSLGRIGKLLTDVNHFVSICRNCHNLIHNRNKKIKQIKK